MAVPWREINVISLDKSHDLIYVYVMATRSEEEIRKIAVDIHEGKVFGSWMMPADEDPSLVFIVLLFLDDKKVKEMEEQETVHCFEYYDKAMPRSINGMPQFMSCFMLNKQETEVLQTLLNELKAQKDRFLESPDARTKKRSGNRDKKRRADQ